MTQDVNKRNYLGFALVAVVVLAAAFAVSLFLFAKNRHERSVFYFLAFGTDDLCSEVRCLPQDSVQGRVSLFIDELLLGPQTNRYRSLFADGTRREFCIEQGDTLYLGLSKDALYIAPENPSIEDAVALLKLNIVKKFTKINTILVYIDGKSVS